MGLIGAWAEALAQPQNLHWHWPWAALLLLWPLGTAVWLARRRQRVLAYADAALRPWAVVDVQGETGARWRRLGQGLVWALLALALAGPRLPSSTAPDAEGAERGGASRRGVDLMLVLDVSASMRETDVAPERLTRARLKLADLQRRLRGERVGLVIVAGRAGLLLPLSDDPVLFADALSLAGQDLIDAKGSDLAAGLQRAGLALAGSARGSRAVVLVTDAEAGDLAGDAGTALAQAAQALQADAVPLFVLAVSTPSRGTPAAGPDGARTPDHAAWGRFAANHGGALASLSDGDADWDKLFDGGLARLRSAPVNASQARSWRELFPLPLLAAVVLLALLGLPPGALRRSAAMGAGGDKSPAAARSALVAAAAATLLLAAPGAPVQAQSQAASGELARGATAPTEQQAFAAWQAEQWTAAQAGYTQLLRRQGRPDLALAAGAAALKAGDAAMAQQLFGRALVLSRSSDERADALYNLAHAQAAQVHWHTAAEAWQAVLLERPGDARAATNLAIARAELARRQRARAMESDLRARRGFVAGGFIQPGGSANLPDPEQLALDAQRDSGSDARGAVLAGGDAAQAGAPFETDARHLASGLAKLGRLADRRVALQQGLFKNERGAAPRTGLAPW